jgi:predicted nucleotide-binding protein
LAALSLQGDPDEPTCLGTTARSALLYEDGVERPSDIEGVLYLPLDPAGAWKAKLAREMRAAQIPIDAEAVLDA